MQTPPEPMDPTTHDTRELMQALLPPARAEYVKAWELLADASTPLERRRAARKRVRAIVDDHAIVAAALREREARVAGDDLLNLRHLADELERHVAALGQLATISPIGLQTAKALRPEALGCGKRYRDPSRVAETDSGTRAVAAAPRSSGRGRGGRPGPGGPGGRDGGRPGSDRDRGPKVPKDALGTSKHESALGDDLDEATRAKLEALRKAMEG